MSAEQLGIGWIGTWISTLDIVNAKLVEHSGDSQLVGKREIDAIGLCAIAQGGVKKIKTFAGHRFAQVNR